LSYTRRLSGVQLDAALLAARAIEYEEKRAYALAVASRPLTALDFDLIGKARQLSHAEPSLLA